MEALFILIREMESASLRYVSGSSPKILESGAKGLTQECVRRSYDMSGMFRFIKEEEGAEVVEVAIWLALVIAASIGTIALIGPKILASFTSVNGSLP